MKRWLIDYIDQAFQDVQLGEGMTIYEGESKDRYGDPHEDLLAATAERIDWRRVPICDLIPRYCALAFLDAQGFRFYTPAIMTLIVNDANDNGLLADWFLNQIHSIRASCKVGEVHYCKLFNRSQRAAILRFCKYLAYNHRCYSHDEALARTLEKLPRCCQEPRLNE